MKWIRKIRPQRQQVEHHDARHHPASLILFFEPGGDLQLMHRIIRWANLAVVHG
jgi:hypothetical protein